MVFGGTKPRASAQTTAITGRSYRLKDSAAFSGKADKNKKSKSKSNKPSSQNRRAEWLAIRFCSLYLAADAFWTTLDFRRESATLTAWY